MIERAGSDESSFCDVFSLLLELHKEGGYAPLDVDKASADTYRVLTQNMTFLARDEDGSAIGVLGLVEVPFWYSAETFLTTKWIYLKPAHRNGPAFRALLHAAKDESETRDKLFFLVVDNPVRNSVPTKSSLEAQILGYIPAGYARKIKGK